MLSSNKAILGRSKTDPNVDRGYTYRRGALSPSEGTRSTRSCYLGGSLFWIAWKPRKNKDLWKKAIQRVGSPWIGLDRPFFKGVPGAQKRSKSETTLWT